MAKSIPVTSNGTKIYTIELTHNFLTLCEYLKCLGYQKDQKVCIVTDSHVGPFYAEEVKVILKNMFDSVFVYTFEAGESSKNLQTVHGLYEYLIFNHFERRDFLVALGGGVVGDLTGFAAATYLRGIDFIQVPTTLLAQVDSSIGGKTGVDCMQYKNMVGAFYQPKLVYMNLSTLTSLPNRQIISGMGEIIKHGLIKDASYYNWLKENHTKILDLDAQTIEEMVYRSCNIKREIVERDPRENGERALLNFGHTIGHAIEKSCNFSLYHGECVGLGILASAYISMQLGNITEKDLENIQKCLVSFGFRTDIKGLVPEDVLSATKSDKKMVGNQVNFILLSNIGNAYIYRELSDLQILNGITCVCHK